MSKIIETKYDDSIVSPATKDIDIKTKKTVVTSVSVSKEFDRLIQLYNLSPTDVFRKGMAVELYEKGAGNYITNLNQTRSKEIKPLLEEIKNFSKILKEIVEKREILNKIDKIIGVSE